MDKRKRMLLVNSLIKKTNNKLKWRKERTMMKKKWDQMVPVMTVSKERYRSQTERIFY